MNPILPVIIVLMVSLSLFVACAAGRILDHVKRDTQTLKASHQGPGLGQGQGTGGVGSVNMPPLVAYNTEHRDEKDAVASTDASAKRRSRRRVYRLLSSVRYDYMTNSHNFISHHITSSASHNHIRRQQYTYHTPYSSLLNLTHASFHPHLSSQRATTRTSPTTSVDNNTPSHALIIHPL